MDISNMINDVKFNYRVGLLIEKGDEVFVEFNPKFDFTTLPGGRVKTLESSKEALFREVKEEMNVEIDLDEISILSIIENFFEHNGKKYHELYILYKIEVLDDKIFYENMKNIDSESSYYKWIKKDDLESINLLPKSLRNIVYNDKFESIIVNDLKI